MSTTMCHVGCYYCLMCNGTCGLPQPGSVFGALDSDGDGVAEATVTLLSGGNAPNGIAWHNGSLYVAEMNRQGTISQTLCFKPLD